MHTWPQVLAILSWLIDFINVCNSANPVFELVSEDGDLQEVFQVLEY